MTPERKLERLDTEGRVATWLAWVSAAAGLGGGLVAHIWGHGLASCESRPDTPLGTAGSVLVAAGFVVWLLSLGLALDRSVRRRHEPPVAAGHLGFALTCASAVYLAGGLWVVLTSICRP